MVSSGKRIPLAEVRQGMFVGDVFNDRDVLLYSARTLITNERQIESLKHQGVTSVFIMTDEPAGENNVGIVSEEHESEIPSAESVLSYAHYQEQLHTAGLIRGQVVEAVRDALDTAKMGRLFQTRRIVLAAEQLVERVTVDPDVYFGLMQIKAGGDCLFAHSVNVAIMTAAFADALNYPRDSILDSVVGGMLHDIGKVRLPEALWMKNGNCTRREFELFRQHPAFGLDLVAGGSGKISDLIKKIIGQHHERWNGGGYPDGALGDTIHEAAIMCALADTYDLLTTRTPYQDACMPQEALATIFQRVDNEYPRPIVEQFARLLGIYPVGSFVGLVSGEKGLVIRINRTALLAPVIAVLIDRKGVKLKRPFVRDLSKGSAHPTDHLQYKIDRSLDPTGYDIFPSWFFMAEMD
jgi:HD-GYP domain-containing protein (c-di-GMP phosphodiesterase class II)